MNIHAPAPRARGATGIPVNRQSLASRWAFFSSFSAIAIALTCISLFSNTAQAQTLTPQGRLTLVSQTPVMASDVVGASTIYYTPYVGNSLPISNGTSLSNGTFSELSLSISTADTQSGHIGDIYAIYVNSAFQLCILSQWPSGTSTTSRGTGAAELTQLNGIWVNANDTGQLCGTPTTNYDIPPKKGIYLGSIWTSPHPASTDVGVTVQFKPSSAAGGTNNLVGMWNAYNRVPAHSLNRDSTFSWTQTNSSGWEVADPGSSSVNKITWIDGLQATSVAALFTGLPQPNSVPAAAVLGINLDSTTATPDLTADYVFGNTQDFNQIDVAETFTPQLGLHYVQAMEYVNFTGSITYYGAPSFAYEALILDFDY